MEDRIRSSSSTTRMRPLMTLQFSRPVRPDRPPGNSVPIGPRCPTVTVDPPRGPPRTLVPEVAVVWTVPWHGVAQNWDLPDFSVWLGGRADATRRAYTGDVPAFAEWMSRSGVSDPEGVDRMHLRRYLASLGTRRLARATIARKAAALRCYFAWLVRQGRLGSDPARSLRAPSGGGRLPRVLSPGEVAALVDVGRADDLGPARPRRARAALRRRTAGLGAVWARPQRRRSGGTNGDGARKGRKTAPGAHPRHGCRGLAHLVHRRA